MASPILDVVEIYQGRRASRGADGTRRQQRQYHVKTVSGFTDSQVVAQAGNTAETAGGPRLPRMYEHLQLPDGTFDFTMRVEDIDVSPNKAHDLWLATVRYTTKLEAHQLAAAGAGGGPGGAGSDGGGVEGKLPGLDSPYAGGGASAEAGGNPQLIEDPLFRPAKVRFYAIKNRKIVESEVDIHNDALQKGGPRVIRNSAGAVFDPPPEGDEVLLGISVQRNVRLFQVANIRRFTNAINKDSWRGVPQRAARIADLAADQQFENGVWFWDVGYKLEVKGDGEDWTLKLLDRGAYYLDGSGNRTDFTTDVGGRRINRGLLDGRGGKLDPTKDPIFLTWYIRQEVDFKALGL